MKILILTTNFPRWKGDFRVPFIFEAARAMHAKGHTVRVITMHNPGAANHEILDGLEVFRARYLPEKLETLQQDAAGIPAAWERGIQEKISMLPYFWHFCLEVAKHSKGFDIIHANWSLSGLAAYITRRIHKTPYIVTVQGSDVFKTVDKLVIKSVIGKALKNAAFVIALSNSLAEVTRKFGVPENQIVVIPNGIDINKFPMGNYELREKRLLFVGSLIERKGVRQLLEAMVRLNTRFPEYTLSIIGEGDQKELLEEFVRKQDLSTCVHFLGTQSQSQVGDLMRKSKLLILPSIEEGQGVVLVEALASGTPCIGSNVGGIPDVIKEDVGRLFKPGDINGLVDAISHFLSNEEIWKKASEAARKRALENYDWDALVNGIITLYKKAMMKEEA
jgi:glycosyltransferase involved in cell wall biosynthesis